MKKLFSGSLMILLILTACTFGNNEEESEPKDLHGTEGSYGIYYYLINSDYQVELVQFKKISTGTYCTVWSDQNSDLDSGTAASIASEFDANIYNAVTSNFADPYDADSDGKVAIFVYQGDDGSSGSYVAGYFFNWDFYVKNSSRPYSNEKDVIYINGAPSNHEPGDAAFNMTLAHEFQHLCNFSYNVMDEHSGDDNYQTFTWIDEGFSENASALCYGYSSNQDRLSYFTYSSFGNGEVSLTLWESQLENYALVYAFFARLYKSSNSIFSTFYNESTNNTTGLNTTLGGGSSLNDQFRGFLIDLKNETSSAFPTNFFPGTFSIDANGSSNPEIIPYAFLYRTQGNFTSINSNIDYLDSSGNLTTNKDNAVAVTWLDNSSWSDDYAGDWSGTAEETKALTSSIQPTMSQLRSISSSSSEPKPIDLHFRNKDISSNLTRKK
ncbi:MAG: hypothetical protein MJB14_06845 [Spirochaetes bacterium]|nr:hypothetical protein [Spirochaetota bacterium]